MGNTSATGAKTRPLRLVSAASNAASNSLSEEMVASSDRAIKDLVFLKYLGWKIKAAKRCQQSLFIMDMVQLHGYVLIQVVDSNNPENVKLVRLDYGEDGYVVQGPVESEDEFKAYKEKKFFDHGMFAAVFVGGPILTASWIPAIAAAGVCTAHSVIKIGQSRDFGDALPEDSTCLWEKLKNTIEEVKHKKYDIPDWNCNHFANLAMRTITGQEA